MPSLNQPSSRAVKTRFHQPAIDSFNDDDDDGESNKEQSQIESSSSLSCASPNYMKPTSCSYAKKGSSTSQQASSNNSESSFDVSESDSWKPNAVSFAYVKPAEDSSSTRVLSLKSNHRQLRKRSPFPYFADYVMPDQEGNESDRSTSGCSSSEDRDLKGAIQLRKTLKKSRSSRRGSFRSSFRTPNYLKATSSSSQKKMQIQASLVDSQLSSLDHEKTIRNSKSSKQKPGSSGNKSTQKNLLRRTSSIRTVKILINKSAFKPKRDSEKNFSQCPHDMTSIRPTCSSTLKNSKFPEHVDLHPGVSESEQRTAVDLCPYSYCSLHGHLHKPPVPPLKRLLSKRRRFLKSQRTMKLRSKSSLRAKNLDDVIKELEMNQLVDDGGSQNQETGNGGVEMYSVGEEEGSDIFVQIYTKPRMGLSRISSEGNEHTNLDEVLFGESSHPQTTSEDWLNQESETIVGDVCFPEEISVHKQIETDCGGIETNSSLPSPKPGISTITSGDEITSLYLERNDVDSADWSHKSSNAVSISETTEENTKEEVGPNGDRDLATDGAVVEELVSAVDSEEKPGATEEYKPQKKNQVSMWHLIHQNMVSGLTEGAQTERLMDANADEHKHGDNGSNSPAPQNSGSSYYEKDNQEIQLQKMYAIKMVREAIEKILLPEVQDQLSDDQSVSSNATSEQDLLDKNNGEGDEQSITDITVNEVLGTAKEVRLVEETKPEKRSLKNWSNLKKLILLKRFINALEKVKTLKLREPQYLPLEPGPDAEKVSLRRGVLDSKKSSEEWMLDYALQQVVSELAPIQKRKVALLVKAFETVVSPSGEPLTPVMFPKSKMTREGSCISNKLDKGASEVASSDSNVEKIGTSGFDNDRDFTISSVQSYVHAAVKKDEVVHEVTREGSCIDNKLEKGASEVISIDTNVENIGTSALDNGQDFTISVEQSYVHEDVKKNEVLHEEVPHVNSECCKEDDHKSNTEIVLSGNLSDATGGTPSLSERASSNDLVQASINNTLISSVCASSPLENHTATAGPKNEDSTLNSDAVEGFGPVRDSGPNNNNQETQKERFKKEKQASMWHMIHRQMVAGLSEESNNTLEKGTDAHLVATESSSSSPGFSASTRNTERGYEYKEGQELELRKIYAVKLVREAIERILLPELEDQPSDDKHSNGEVTTEAELMEKHFDSDAEPVTLSSSDYAKHSIKIRDNTMLSQEDSKLQIAHMPEAARQDVASDAQTKSEKQTPKGWSNLKKLILLKRFIKELEKVKKFNPRKPQFLPLMPDLEAEQVRLRAQMMDQRRSAEEWMLDYALRKVVSELAPKQKRKVELLVKAFETVAPPSEEPQVQVTFPKLKGINGDSYWSGSEQYNFATKDAEADKKSKDSEADTESKDAEADTESMDAEADTESKDSEADTESKDAEADNESKDALRLDAKISENSSTISNKISDVFVHDESCEDTTSGLHEKFPNICSESNANLEKLDPLKNVPESSPGTGNEMEYGRGDPFEQLTPGKEKTVDSAIDCTTEVACPTKLDKQKHIKMWHLLCQHVVSSIDAKVETQILDGDDEYDQAESPSTTPPIKSSPCHGTSKADHDRNKEDDLSRKTITFSRRSAVQLVRDAIEEILQPELQDDSSDAQSNASDMIMEQELEEKNQRVFGALNIVTPTSSVEDSFGTEMESPIPVEERTLSMEGSKFSQQKSTNWSKLKKVILLKRTIKALEKARKYNPSVPRSLPLAPDLKEEKVDLKHLSADEKKKAEEWMLDHALQHAVSKLTPARKRRVSMLVEAFEAVVPLPQV